MNLFFGSSLLGLFVVVILSEFFPMLLQSRAYRVSRTIAIVLILVEMAGMVIVCIFFPHLDRSLFSQ